MEHLPPRSPDEEPHGPEDERLWPGEIDLTGVVRQDDALADVIGDAIGEAEGGNGEVPEWGARTLARALANERDDPMSGALHHFAVTGQADPEAIARELADLYQTTTDDEIREWVNWLGTYVIRLSDGSAEPPGSEESSQPADEPDTPQIEQGLREHGDAFRAYLQLPDVDPGRDDLLQTFHEFYIGAFDSMHALLEELTEIREWQRAIDEAARRGGFEEFITLEQAKIEAVARVTWDIIEIGGKLHVFSK